MSSKIVFRAEFFKEYDQYVGLAPELGISSFGPGLEAAKASLQEAADAFVEECEALGTLEEVLEEAGFEHVEGQWRRRRPVASDLLATG